MTDANLTATSLLAIDVGSVTTRAFFFDAVEGGYRLVAQGIAPTTLEPPFRDASAGVQLVLDQLHEITGRIFAHADSGIIIPTDPEGNGVDAVAVTLSAGAPLRTMAVGLLEDISVESAQNLLSTLYAKVFDHIGMNDRRKLEERIDAILQARPDLIVIAGGTEGGASKSVSKLIEPIGLACYLLPEHQRPHILFAGNSVIATEVQNDLSGIVPVDIAPNVRPSLESEQLSSAQKQIREMNRLIRVRDNAPLMELSNWSGGRMMPATQGFARIVQFFSKYYPPGKGVLGVDLGASSTTIAAAFSGTLNHRVYSDLGLGSVLPHLLKYTSLGDIARWTQRNVSASEVQAYIQQKVLHPSSLPVTAKDNEMEQALAREILRAVVRASKTRFPKSAPQAGRGLLPWFEPVVVSGSVLTNAPTRAQSLLMILDGLELTGITTVVLDQFNLVSALGAASELNPLLAVQVIDTGALVNLAVVISPVVQARTDTPVLRVRVTYESGEEKKLDLNYGNLEKIPLHPGEEAKLSLQPLNRANIGMGRAGLGGGLKVKGSEMGIVIDARGRPLHLSSDASRRRESFQKWLKVLES
ncbi:MAG TPA: glutamate mutase L [Anaerolineales bacterium]|nr:glutamate mutase L [Anaerolineales bacterium]